MNQMKIKNTPDCMMVSLRDVRVTNTMGACVWLKANEPMMVPGVLVDDAAALGCVPVDSNEYESHKTKLEKVAKAQEELKEKLIDATDILVRRNDFKDFTSTGHPRIEALAIVAEISEKEITEQMRDHAFAEWSSRNRRSVQSKQSSKKAQ